ncbi:hypothetical protein SS1G_02293 [Sclerotinia sclerotiorum 1980 UF-70]|uniref:Transcription activator of gluconeogenesis SS1G_02293 n=1 Tax=Sclerotinia sclerotiorum (strain ATCC 18683 / 1980 / Ss-1) TaxID=665079 RepID=ACUK_SCLS1|nr:hypothetical protein SS1G_02293 [Sclerotinia sclerotiorum 1980 UF-70]A7EAG1.1 RecName: Full=Transcription activator of gluconeogenesis SS1G_02293 [Sclerotinia sclerotiorum 1980 UF-70]EDN99439.1 hypothetical protein SS1G_02293 [Sclerotinia sclerotiorum 1980 UF-70]
MSGETEIDDPEVSDGASENDYSDHEQELDVVGKEDDNQEMAEQKVRPDGDENGNTVGAAATATKPKFDPKDPLRPRRKKARRACFACQRAHLTCGDERPCQRCIKRGLADACQDGVRKKAKYLHDAPPEALRPVLGPTYNQQVSNNRATAASTPTEPSTGMGNFFTQPDTSPSYPLFAANQQGQMPPPLQNRLSFGSNQPSPISPTFHTVGNRPAGMQGISLPQVSNDSHAAFGGGAFFDPSNPALFNFDLEGLNFGNHYGALEFGMLGHMASGSAETPPQDSSAGMPQNVGDLGYNNNPAFNNNPPFNQIYSHDALPDFAVAPPGAHRPAKRQDTKSGPSGKLGPSSALGKRNRDPSSIYDTVHEPYSYTTGFHSLTAFIQKRFSPNKTLRIAKSLASIRPSFISCTKTLNRQDLVFMEKCFQRTLFEYEDFMLNCCTPTLVCRRTGEIAAVNKEFTLLTGWRKEVLLGNEPNLNINTGNSGASSSGSSGRGSFTTPRMRPINLVDSNTASLNSTKILQD